LSKLHTNNYSIVSITKRQTILITHSVVYVNSKKIVITQLSRLQTEYKGCHKFKKSFIKSWRWLDVHQQQHKLFAKKIYIFYLLEKLKTFGKQFFCILSKFICIARLYYLWFLKILIYVEQPIFILELFSFHNAFFLKCCVPFRITRCKLLLFLLKKDFLRK
jgi:hypothetical protein